MTLEYATREKGQAPPPRVVWQALSGPNRDPRRLWLRLRDDEVPPRVVEAVEPTLVVWSSMWPDRLADEIRFDLRPDGSGCRLRWTLLTPDAPPDEARVAQLRHRLNLVVNGELRSTFGQ